MADISDFRAQELMTAQGAAAAESNGDIMGAAVGWHNASDITTQLAAISDDAIDYAIRENGTYSLNKIKPSARAAFYQQLANKLALSIPPAPSGPTSQQAFAQAVTPHYVDPGIAQRAPLLPGVQLGLGDAAIRNERAQRRDNETQAASHAISSAQSGRHHDAAAQWSDAAFQARQITALAAAHPALGLDPPEEIAGDPGRYGDSEHRAADYSMRAQNEDHLAAAASGGSATTDAMSPAATVGWFAAGAALLYAAWKFLK